MKKKILSLVLVVAMLASMLVLAPVSGATEADVVVSVTKAAASAGDIVSVDLVVTTNQPLHGLMLAYGYDSSKLRMLDDAEDGVAGVVFPKGSGTAKDQSSATDDTYNYSPYQVLSWAKPSTGPLDASEGVVVATLNFAVLDDSALGNAEVAVYDTGINYIVNTAAGGITESIDYVPGGVTILPDGYLDPNENVASDFGDLETGWAYWNSTYGDIIYVEDYESLEAAKADADGVAIIGYETEDTSLVVPSTIDGLPVKVIYSKAFTGAEFVSVVLPESVELVQDYAFNDCASLTTVYVCNDAIEIGKKAFGYSVTFRSNGKENKSTLLTKEDGATPLTTLFSPQGSGAETYATDWEIGFVAATLAKVKFDDLVCFVAGNLPAPGMVEVDGKLAVAWKDQNGTVYAAGATMALTGDTELEPITIAKPQTSTEVGLKLADSWKGLSMRFKATFGVADYDTLVEVAGEGGKVDLGMLITPARYVSYAGAFTKEALAEFKVGDKTYSLGEDAYVDVALNGYFSKTDDEYTFAARLQNFSDTTLAKNPDFAAVMYATVTTADGATFTVYGDFNFAANNSVLDVAKNTSTEGQTDTIKGAVANLIKKLNGEEV